MDNLKIMFSDAAAQVYAKTMEVLPVAALAIVIIGIGFLVASALYYLTKRVLDFFAVDKLAAKTPLDRMLKGVGIRKHISDIFAILVFWLAVFVTLIYASEKLNLEQVSNVLGQVTLFIPKVIASLVIIIFGMLLAKFLELLTRQALTRAELKIAGTASRAVYFIVLVLVVLLSIEQLGIDLSFITTNVMILMCALLLIFSVGAMIATRTILENAMACYQLKKLLSVGEEVHLHDANISGVVEGFTPTGVIISCTKSKNRTVVPALHFLTQSYCLAQPHDH